MPRRRSAASRAAKWTVATPVKWTGKGIKAGAKYTVKGGKYLWRRGGLWGKAAVITIPAGFAMGLWGVGPNPLRAVPEMVGRPLKPAGIVAHQAKAGWAAERVVYRKVGGLMAGTGRGLAEVWRNGVNSGWQLLLWGEFGVLLYFGGKKGIAYWKSLSAERRRQIQENLRRAGEMLKEEARRAREEAARRRRRGGAGAEEEGEEAEGGEEGAAENREGAPRRRGRAEG